jgi:DNA-binding LytR/AlgR family response regulator
MAVFTDIQMPGEMDGIALAHEIQRCWPWVHLLVTSGQLQPTAAELPPKTRFLPKPYRGEHAVRQVREMAALT